MKWSEIMILHTVYMSTIDLQAKIHGDFERIHGLDLTLRELNEVIADYKKYCQENEPITTQQFVKTYLEHHLKDQYI